MWKVESWNNDNRPSANRVHLDKVVQCAGYRGRVAGATNLTLDCPVEQLFRRYYSGLVSPRVLKPREGEKEEENAVSE